MPETISYIDINSQTYEIKDSEARTALTGKQDTLVSGNNIKTIDGESLLGSGNLAINKASLFVLSDAKSLSVTQGTNYFDIDTTNSDTVQLNIYNSNSNLSTLHNVYKKQYVDDRLLDIHTELTHFGTVLRNKPYIDVTYTDTQKRGSVYNDDLDIPKSLSFDTFKADIDNTILFSLQDGESSENYSLPLKGYVDNLFATAPIGKTEGGTGIYAPSTITPGRVGDGSLLITEGSGTTLGPKSIAVSTGKNMTCKSAAAGSTVYRFANTYANRIFAATVAIAGAVAALSEAAAKEGLYANVLSVQVNNSNFTIPDSSATSGDNIVITLDKTINPDSATTTVRFYPGEGGFSTVHAGQGIGSKEGNGGSVLVGQGVGSNGGNACALVGADLFNTGNGNAVFGRQHISRKNRWFMAGTGHDNTNGKSESGAVFGEFADIKSDTAFAIGNGTSQTVRSNLFEIKTNGDMYINGTKVL